MTKRNTSRELTTTLREFDEKKLPKLEHFSMRKIKRLRYSAGYSQAVFAKLLNVSLATIKQWERGERQPGGPALKLLNLAKTKGFDVLL